MKVPGAGKSTGHSTLYHPDHIAINTGFSQHPTPLIITDGLFTVPMHNTQNNINGEITTEYPCTGHAVLNNQEILSAIMPFKQLLIFTINWNILIFPHSRKSIVR